LLSFPYVYFFESRLFNALRAKKTKKTDGLPDSRPRLYFRTVSKLMRPFHRSAPMAWDRTAFLRA
jgi:hypothetical protein